MFSPQADCQVPLSPSSPSPSSSSSTDGAFSETQLLNQARFYLGVHRLLEYQLPSDVQKASTTRALIPATVFTWWVPTCHCISHSQEEKGAHNAVSVFNFYANHNINSHFCKYWKLYFIESWVNSVVFNNRNNPSWRQKSSSLFVQWLQWQGPAVWQQNGARYFMGHNACKGYNVL